MKKNLSVWAVLGVCAGGAFAQSSVVVYGTIDLSGKYVKNEGSAKRLSLARDGLNSSQLGVLAIEDLGGGLKAGINLIASVGADAGDIGGGQSATGSGKFWSRRSTISLFGKAGELRLGRDYTPTFWNLVYYDPFGAVGVGADLNVIQMLTSTVARADNSVGYFLPGGLGGIYGQAMVAAAEGGPLAQPGQTGNSGRFVGGRFGYKAGPVDVAVAAASVQNSPFGGVQKSYNAGALYDFRIFKLMAYVDRESASTAYENRGGIGATIPFDQSLIGMGYDRGKLRNSSLPGATYNNTVWQAKANYVYNLSKRTAMYGSVSKLSNGNRSRLGIASGSSVSAAPLPGGDSKGFELGLRHVF